MANVKQYSVNKLSCVLMSIIQVIKLFPLSSEMWPSLDAR